jgi:antitoxin VapB
MQKKAKLFMNGRSQAVRLPREFRFEGQEVNIRKDPETGDVVLSMPTKPYKSWSDFTKSLEGIEVPESVFDNLRHIGPNRPDPFEGWDE